VTYEAMAAESVGIIMYAHFFFLVSRPDSCFRESLSDNLNRTIANLREIFNDHGFDLSHLKLSHVL